jgi:lipopolysaccharide transport system permease protein
MPDQSDAITSPSVESSLTRSMDDVRTPQSSPGWDLVIRPKTGWLELHLADLWRYRDLTMLFVWRDFVSYYKQTILGPLWYLLQPLATTVIFTLFFGRIAKLSTDGAPHFLFYMAGVTAWTYFAECLTRTSGTFITNAGMFGKVYFPRLCVPISMVISNLIKFGIQFLLFLCFLLIFMLRGADVHPNILVLITPCLLILLAGFGLGAGIIISSLTTKYRDLQFLVTFGAQLLMFATPVIYPLSMVPEQFRWLMLINPMTPIVETFRFAYLGTGHFALFHLLYSTAATGLTLFLGILLFNRVERTFMDTV